ncbi:TPA: phosphate propanoyltransferase [Streptococcus suis]|nr:phosphate propanoyltransferase [Streptococcus suis]
MGEDLESMFYKVIDFLDGNATPEPPVPSVPKKINRTPDVFGANLIPVGVSNRHIHLSQADADILFGPGYTFNVLKELSQKEQFAYKECVIISGPKGAIEKVRILGPARKETQVEVLKSDCYKLGIDAPLRLSGDIDNTPGCTVIGPAGSIQMKKGCIVAKRHIHMSPADAQRFDVRHNQIVSLKLPGERGGIMNNVIVRVNDAFSLECHIDTEEANAFGVTGQYKLKLIK